MLFLDEQSVRDVEQDIQQWVDLWPADGAGPQGAAAVSAALAVGIAAYDRTRPLEDRIIDGIRAADGRVAYDYKSAKAVERLIKLWLVPVPRAYDAITVARRDGGTVHGVDTFVDRVDDADMGTAVSVDRAKEMVERRAREDPELFRAGLRGLGHVV